MPNSAVNDRNPFATSATRPGAIDYVFADDSDTATLIARMRQSGWCGQIVGPHGSGKSTLLCALVPRIAECGRSIVRFTLTRGQRRLPLSPAQSPHWDDRTQVIVDGCEQLTWRQRRRLMTICRRSRSGLLVTTHHSLGLPTLSTTTTTVDLAEQLVVRLTAGSPQLVESGDIAASFTRHRGNLRELFFELYDLYEMRRKEHVDR